MRAAVVGAGSVGARAARQLAASGDVDAVTVVDVDEAWAARVAASVGPAAVSSTWTALLDDVPDVVVLAHPGGTHVVRASELVAAGAHVVSTSDDVGDVRGLLALDGAAAGAAVHVVAGAAFAPGLTCLLARLAASGLDVVDEVVVVRAAVAGRACADGRRVALAGRRTAPVALRGGELVEVAAGVACGPADLPPPVGRVPTLTAAVPDPLLLARAFPGLERASARLAATALDVAAARVAPRVAAGASRLRRIRAAGPDDAELGAVRVEVRGRRPDGSAATLVHGSVDRPGQVAGAVAALAALAAGRGELRRTGAGGLAELLDDVGSALGWLADRGVRTAVLDPPPA